MDQSKAHALFDHWEETMIWSCLQGYMGKMMVDNEIQPTAAMIDIADFCFLAGQPSDSLLAAVHGYKLLVPKSSAWETPIEQYFGNRVKKRMRYAFKKEADVFDCEKLTAYAAGLEDCFELRMFDEEIYALAKQQSWSSDLCSQYETYEDYQRLAIGAAILYHGELVAGASSYTVYQNGIEIEIDTKPEFRCRGLATVCGAKLILECLARNLYPSWDAHDLRSASLAEKLGYRLSHPYVTYEHFE